MITRHPRLYLHFHCGCRVPLNSLDDAIVHAIETLHAKRKSHTVTIIGSLILQRQDVADPEGPVLNESVIHDLKITCGCGFFASSVNKAIEHLVKTGDKMKVYGKVSFSRK